MILLLTLLKGLLPFILPAAALAWALWIEGRRRREDRKYWSFLVREMGKSADYVDLNQRNGGLYEPTYTDEQELRWALRAVSEGAFETSGAYPCEAFVVPARRVRK